MKRTQDSTSRLAVAYCRVSTDHEEQKKSIQEQQRQWLEMFSQTGAKHAEVGLLCHRQVTRIREDGKAVKGKLITAERTDGLYIDEGISGKSLQNRKAFQRMIEDAMLKKFDMIYVEDVSRFSRSMEDGYTVIKNLRDIGVGVYFRKEGWDSLDLSKDFELQLRLSIAQEENRTKSDRIKWSMDRLRKKGGWDSTPPYGYDKVDGFLQVNEEEAKYIKMMFTWFTVEMWGLGKIAKELNRIEAPTKRGGTWRPNQISGMLQNEIYTGKQVTHRVETYDITRHTKKDIDPTEWVVMQKEELRLIDDDLFALTQVEYARRTENYTFGARRSNDTLLSGLLFCAFCGSTYRRKKRNHYRKKDGTITDYGYMWVCHLNDSYGNKNKGKGGVCPGERVQVNEDEVIKAIQYEIEGLKNSNTDAFFMLYMQEKFKGIEAKNKDKLEKRSKDLNGEMRQLRQDRRDNLVDEDLYKDQMKELNTEISEVKADLSRIERVTEEKKHQLELYEAYKRAIQEVDTENLTNAVLKGIFHKIYVSYTKDGNGKKTPTLRFVYKFLDSTNDDIIQAQVAGGRKDMGVNLHIFTSIYAYKTEEEINKTLKENGVGELPKAEKKAQTTRRKTKGKKLF